jgi:hypothetical protein
MSLPEAVAYNKRAPTEAHVLLHQKWKAPIEDCSTGGKVTDDWRLALDILAGTVPAVLFGFFYPPRRGSLFVSSRHPGYYSRHCAHRRRRYEEWLSHHLRRVVDSPESPSSPEFWRLPS